MLLKERFHAQRGLQAPPATPGCVEKHCPEFLKLAFGLLVMTYLSRVPYLVS